MIKTAYTTTNPFISTHSIMNFIMTKLKATKIELNHAYELTEIIFMLNQLIFFLNLKYDILNALKKKEYLLIVS